MTTAIRTGDSLTSKMRTIDLLCVCGKRLQVSIRELPESGGVAMADLKVVASASNWKICEDYIQRLTKSVDAYCSNCWRPAGVWIMDPLPCLRHAP